MTALQASIGALNDLVDAPRDAGLKPGKPIPAGIVAPPVARLVVGLAAAIGLALAAPSGPALIVVALLVLAAGWTYDLRLKGTPWSWLPFALGIPLLPVFAWVGATGGLPAASGALLPAAFLAGAALAIANALPDVERDQARGAATVAVHLGRVRAWRVHLVLLVSVAVIALVGLVRLGGTGWGVAVIAIGLAAAAGGVALLAGGTPHRRERGWELEAVGIGLVAAGWLAAVVTT